MGYNDNQRRSQQNILGGKLLYAKNFKKLCVQAKALGYAVFSIQHLPALAAYSSS